VGAILAPLIVPWVTFHYGWHAAFITTGLFSALWILWWFSRYRGPSTATLNNALNVASIPHTPSTIPWRSLLRCRQTWAYTAAKFLTDPIWYFYMFWLPSYFSAKFNLNLLHIGLPLIIVYNFSVVGSIGGGWLPTPFRRMGLSATNARLAAMFFCACLVVPIFAATRVSSEWSAIALISLATGAHQGWSANLFTTPSDMFPRNAVGSIVGFGGMIGAIGGAMFAFFAGHVLQFTHSYASLFTIAASAYLLALAALCLLAPGLKKAEIGV
jgi:ACS family hexuronate transporter-like MFS transporter